VLQDTNSEDKVLKFNQFIAENPEYDKEIEYLTKLDKEDPKKAAAFRKRTAALKKGGGWNLQQKPTPAQVKTLKDMAKAAKKKHPELYKK